MTHEEYENLYQDALHQIRSTIIGETIFYRQGGRKIEIDGDEWADDVVFAKAKNWCKDHQWENENVDRDTKYRHAMECIRANIIGEPETDSTSRGRVIRINERHYFDAEVFAKAWGAEAAGEIMSRKPRG